MSDNKIGFVAVELRRAVTFFVGKTGVGAGFTHHKECFYTSRAIAR
ncbi:MAG: hypothetical protein ACI9FJ_000777 [Alteromonadaceae bacterium]|jgi:hypothetical protein